MIPCLHFGLRLASGRFPIEPKLASRVESGYKSPDSPGPRQRGRRRDGLSRRRRGRFRSTAPYPAATNSRGVSKPRARRDNGLTLGMVSHPRPNRDVVEWIKNLLQSGAEILVPEIADYYPGNQDPHKSLQPIRSSNSRSRLPRDQRSTTESTEIHGKENPNQLPLSVSFPGATPARRVGSFRGYPFVMIFLAGVIRGPP